MKRLLVLGRSGQLARELARRLSACEFSVEFAGRDRIDFSDPHAVHEAVLALAPDMIINAAAYTLVDRAEEETDRAWAINAEAPGALARACKTIGGVLVHVSTDYVFDGAKEGAYFETDPVSPRNAYGVSKARGEALVCASGARASILRTSWVHSAFGSNFVKTMLRLAQTSETVRVVGDQWGRPTWAHALAGDCIEVARRLLEGDARVEGILHATAGGEPCTWADVAECVFAAARDLGAPSARVERIASSDYPTRAVRPSNSVLALDRIEAVLGARPHWRDGVRAACAEIWRDTAVSAPSS